MARYAICVNVLRCIGCYACVVGCNNWHEEDANRIRIIDRIEGKYPDITRWIFPIMCMQCEDAICMEKCPKGAIKRRKNGIVFIDEDICIGCGECVDSCPYGAISLDKKRGKAKKCNFCMDRIESGKEPFCVQMCPTDALLFGNLEDPEDKVSKLVLSRKASPIISDKKVSVFYVNLPIRSKSLLA